MLTAALARSKNKAMPDLSEFMTTAQAATKLKIHVKTIPAMVKNKKLNGVRFGRVWLVSKKSVQDCYNNTKGMSKNDPRRRTK